jgi:flagellar basal body-associated protein FliL
LTVRFGSDLPNTKRKGIMKVLVAIVMVMALDTGHALTFPGFENVNYSGCLGQDNLFVTSGNLRRIGNS